ncbi:unnamed protein product, partial [Dibothriocephalus latus]
MATNASANSNASCLQTETWLGGPTNGDFLSYNRFMFLSVIGIPICAVGVVTSALSICLFCRNTATPRTTLFYRADSTWIQFYKSIGYMLPICSLVNILESLRNWLVVLIGVERFLVVCFPVRSKVWWNERINDCLIAACFGFSIMIRLPLIFLLAV